MLETAAMPCEKHSQVRLAAPPDRADDNWRWPVWGDILAAHSTRLPIVGFNFRGLFWKNPAATLKGSAYSSKRKARAEAHRASPPNRDPF